jgi:plastocyanin
MQVRHIIALEGEMVVNRIFKLGIMVVFIFILLTGLAASAQVKEKTAKTTEMNQTMNKTTNQMMNQTMNQTHTIVLINNQFTPETTEVNQYDTVIWRNLNKPKRTFVLESNNGLWEDFTLGYGRSFQYTFNETGTFGFGAEGESNLKGTVVVRESRETAGAPLTEKETRQIQQEEQGEEELTPTPTEKVTPTPTEKVITPTELVKVSENSVVIRGSVFYPATIELNKGETLVFKNLNKPKRSFTLVSEEELFEDQLIGYGRSFAYIFDKAGDYTFTLEELTDIELTVTVK